VEAEETGLVVASVEGSVAVNELLVGDDLSQTGVKSRATAHSAIPGAHKGLDDHEGDVVRVAPGDTLESNGSGNLVDNIITDTDLRTSVLKLGQLGVVEVGGLGEVGEGLAREINKLIVVDGTCLKNTTN
jgi:hypothetical protein